MATSYTMAEEPDTDVGYSKRKQEESKPRQEAVVKTITPDQPAPIVERRERTTAASPAADEAAEGFLSRLFGLFRKKPSAPAEAASPAKTPSRERNDRGGRSGRGRGRGGRGRDKQEERTGAEAKAPKEQREPKETKEAREPKEAANQRQPKPQREPREPREAGEGRQRQPRAPREERKPAQADEVVLATPATGLDHDAAQPDLLSPQTEGGTAENGEDAPRRRRRRGGRNRNRRDRTNGEAMPGDQDGEFAEGSEASDVSEAAQMAEASHVVHVTPTFQEQAAPQPAPVNVEVPVTAAPVATPAVTEIASTASVAHSTPAANPVPEPAASHQAAVHEVEAPIVRAETVSVQVPPSVPVTHVVPKAAQQPSSADIDTLLREAGLTMAVTDPEKLRAVEASSDNVPPKTRVPRERKPLQLTPDEPLVQVETQR
jgi:ribonuclease E